MRFLQSYLGRVLVAATLCLTALPASAAVLGVYTHDYGSAVGKYDPGGNDVLYSDSVMVSDQSSSRFSDFFDFSAITGTITSLSLTLTFDGAGPNCPAFICGLGEFWQVRAQGSDGSGSADDIFSMISDGSSPQTFVYTFLGDILLVSDVFMHSIATGIFEFWFSESSLGSDSFALDSATLTVNGKAAVVPVPAPLLLLGSGLIGLGAMARLRRRRS